MSKLFQSHVLQEEAEQERRQTRENREIAGASWTKGRCRKQRGQEETL